MRVRVLAVFVCGSGYARKWGGGADIATHAIDQTVFVLHTKLKQIANDLIAHYSKR